jgi:hypothetical protein
MNVREYYKKKLGEPLSEIHEDLYTCKELMDLAQECVNEALRQAKNNDFLDLVMQSDYPPEYIRIACAEYYRKKTPLRAIKLVKKYTNMDIKTAKRYCDSHFA